MEPGNQKVVISRDVIFRENEMPYKEAESSRQTASSNVPVKVELLENSDDQQLNEEAGVSETDEQIYEISDDEESVPEETNLDDYRLARDRERRKNVKKPARYSNASLVYYAFCAAEEVESNEPGTYKEAVSSKERVRWIKAMQDEIDSLLKNKTWILVTKKLMQKIIGCKWIFKKKVEASDGDRIRYKARLVAKGYNQRGGIDYNEIFSPVVKHSSIRLLMALVAKNDWELHQLDVKTTFSHGELEESIFMEQPEGFIKPGDEGKACLLKRSIYGLKQSSRQ